MHIANIHSVNGAKEISYSLITNLYASYSYLLSVIEDLKSKEINNNDIVDSNH